VEVGVLGSEESVEDEITEEAMMRRSQCDVKPTGK
jgi:hypothetical protein